MKLHNKLNIIKDGKVVKTEYNTMTAGLSNYISAFVPYNNFLVLSTNTSAVSGNEYALSHIVCSKRSEVENSNFNPLKGSLFVTTRANIQNNSSEDVSFLKVAISAEGLLGSETGELEFGESASEIEANSANIVDCFVLKNSSGEPENFVLASGESIEVEVTVYLEFSKSSSNLNICGANNPFCAMLMGVNILEPSENAPELTLCAGGNHNPTSTTITRTNATDLTELESSCMVSAGVDRPVVNFNITGSTGQSAIKELVVCYGGVACMRINNFDECELSELVQTTGLTADKGCEVTLTQDMIAEVVDVVEESSGAHIDFNVTRFGRTFGDVCERPFGEKDYNDAEVKYYAIDGKMVAYVVDGQLDIYLNKKGEFKKLNSSNISAKNLEKMVMGFGFVVARYIKSTYKRKMVVYKLQNDEYFSEVELKIKDLNLEEPFVWDFNRCAMPNTYGLIVSGGNFTKLIFLQYLPEQNLLESTVEWVSDKVYDAVAVAEACNAGDLAGYAYSASYPSGSNSVYIVNGEFCNTTLNSLSWNLYTKLSPNCPKTGDGFITGAYYEPNIYKPRVTWFTCYNLKSNTLLLAKTDKAMYVSQTGREIIGIQNTGRFFAYHVSSDCAVKKYYPTFNGVDGKKVKDIAILDGVALFYFSDGSPIKSVLMGNDYVKIGPVVASQKYTVKYYRYVLPGSSEEKTINVNINCEA